jgi:hypothetical protein
MSQSVFVSGTAQQEFVRLLDKALIRIEGLERGILGRGVALSRSAFLPASTPAAELRRSQEAQQKGLSVSARLELPDLVSQFERLHGAAKHDPKRCAHELRFDSCFRVTFRHRRLRDDVGSSTAEPVQELCDHPMPQLIHQSNDSIIQ